MDYKKAISIKWKTIIPEVSPDEVINVIFPNNHCMSIPKLGGNSHYDDLMKQVDAGEVTIEPADEPDPEPEKKANE